MGNYYRPEDLPELLDRLSGGHLTVLAGGTDYYPAKVGKPLDDDILDVTAVSSLKGIESLADGWRIGATTCWSDIVAADLPPLFDGLKLAAREVGGRQIQNSGTIGGNICNASPAADGVPALLSLGADVEIASSAGIRRVPLSEFILGNRRTLLTPSDLLTAFVIPKPATEKARGFFEKLGSRKYLVISLAMVAGTVSWDDMGHIVDCRIVIGSCSEVAQRLTGLEQNLIGMDLTEDLTTKIENGHFESLSPINDVRATGEYRRHAAMILVRNMLENWRQDHGA